MAAPGGLTQRRFVWSEEFRPDGEIMCNTFDGTFPIENTAEHGRRRNGSRGRVSSQRFRTSQHGRKCLGMVQRLVPHDFPRHRAPDGPSGPPTGEAKVMRGGSYLCHDPYCHRYRVSARSSNTADSSTGNLGSRVATDSADS